MWGHSVNGTRRSVIVDKQAIERGLETAIDGVTYAGDNDDLDNGQCTLHIANVTENHIGLWACALVSKKASIFSGAVHLGNQTFTTYSHMVPNWT